MRTATGCRRELTGLLAEMPFLDRLEMAALSGRSTGAVYDAARRLEGEGLIAPVRHGTDLVAPTRRFHLTADGVRGLAREKGTDLEDLLRDRPVSARWRRVLLERLDVVGVIYRLVSAIAGVVRPVAFRWYRTLPLDATATLPDGRTVGIVRQGPATDRTGFSKRLWRLARGPRPGVILMLAPDEVRLRYARRLLARTPATALLALERRAVAAGPDEPVWRLASVNAELSLRPAIERLPEGGSIPEEKSLARPRLPGDIHGYRDPASAPDFVLPSLLRPAEKRVLDLVFDWPWIGVPDLAGLLGVTNQRASTLASSLERWELVARSPVSGRRLALTDLGLAVLARRDRASVGLARRRWSASPADAAGWREVAGRRSRQLLRNMEHTTAVHRFAAAMSRQARELGWEIRQLDPPGRASRYFRHRGGLRSIQADAFFVIRREGTVRPFFLEWERRAVRPATMARRLAPYLRYYASHRPIDDHGAVPVVLVVFQEELAATHFLRVAAEEMARTRTAVPLLVAHRSLLEREGPLGRAWTAPGGLGPGHPLPVAS